MCASYSGGERHRPLFFDPTVAVFSEFHRKDEASWNMNDLSEGGIPQHLFVDIKSFEEQFLQCPICQELFNKDTQKPKTLPCGHVFCIQCLVQIFSHVEPKHTLKKSIKCPACNKELKYSRQEIEELQNDFRIVQMWDFMAEARKKSENVCLKHQVLLNFFCRDCSVPVCGDCVMTNHRETKNHRIIDINTVLGEEIIKIEEIKRACEHIWKKSESKISTLNEALIQLSNAENRLKKEADDKFKEIFEALQEKQKQINEQINKTITDERNDIQSALAIIQDSNTSVFQRYSKEFADAKSSRKILQILSVKEKMKQYQQQKQKFEKQNDSVVVNDIELIMDFKELLILSKRTGKVLTVPSSYHAPLQYTLWLVIALIKQRYYKLNSEDVMTWLVIVFVISIGILKYILEGKLF